MKIEIGMNIKAYKSRCTGIIIDSVNYSGKIIKVNKKSIRVQLEHMIVKHGNKITHDTDYAATITYRFWKTTSDGRDIYVSDGRIYGIIEIAQ